MLDPDSKAILDALDQPQLVVAYAAALGEDRDVAAAAWRRMTPETKGLVLETLDEALVAYQRGRA